MVGNQSNGQDTLDCIPRFLANFDELGTNLDVFHQFQGQL
jgi:hypothetical protein